MTSLQNKIATLGKISSPICLSLFLPTHRTFPDNQQDMILLKNLLHEAEKNIINRYGKRESAKVVENISKISELIDSNYNLDSLHVFVSDDILEIIHLPTPITNSEVIINDHFDVQYLEDSLAQSKEYLILMLSQSGVHLFDTINDNIISEIRNNDFPFSQNNHYITHGDKASDSKQIDNMVKEYFNKVDKALQHVSQTTSLKAIVICTPRNYQHLMAVTDKASSYIGNSPINYNDVALHTLAEQAWKSINSNS